MYIDAEVYPSKKIKVKECANGKKCLFLGWVVPRYGWHKRDKAQSQTCEYVHRECRVVTCCKSLVNEIIA